MTPQGISLERIVEAVEKVRERLLRAATALDSAGVAYAVAGGQAVAAWVSTVRPAAVRITRDVDIVLRDEDRPAAARAMEAAGFRTRTPVNIRVFVDGPDGAAEEGVHLILAGRKVRSTYALPAPDVTASIRAPEGFRVLTLEALVAMKLTSFRLKDQVHLQDMVQVGLVDRTWVSRVDPRLSSRLEQILDNPEDTAPELSDGRAT